MRVQERVRSGGEFHPTGSAERICSWWNIPAVSSERGSRRDMSHDVLCGHRSHDRRGVSRQFDAHTSTYDVCAMDERESNVHTVIHLHHELAQRSTHCHWRVRNLSKRQTYMVKARVWYNAKSSTAARDVHFLAAATQSNVVARLCYRRCNDCVCWCLRDLSRGYVSVQCIITIVLIKTIFCVLADVGFW